MGLLALALLAHASVAQAQDSPRPRHELVMGLGIPLPLNVHGYDARGAKASVGFIGHALVGYRWRPLPSLGWLAIGAQAGAAHMAGSLSETAGQISWWTLSPQLLVSFAPIDRWPKLTLEAGGGPAWLRHTVYIDRDINKLGHSLGGQFFAALGWSIHQQLRLMARAGFDLYAQPYDEPTWYNKTLGQTRFASFDLVLAIGWGQ